MSAPTLRIPESVAEDPSDVADALEVASALWGKGQSEEAIRWLRRAVAAASEADDAVRAAGLAGAAADLEDAVKQPSAAPPASRAPTEGAAAPPPAVLPAETQVEPSAEATAVPAPTTVMAATAMAATASNGAATAEEVSSPEPPHEPHDSAEATVPDSPAAMIYANGASSSAAPAETPPLHAPTASVAPRAPTASVPPRASSVPAPRSTFAKPPVIHPTHSPTALPDLPARMRVSVKTSVRDAGLLFVRALANGEEAPPGTLEAFLVREAVQANADAPGDAAGEESGTPEGSAP